MAGQRRPRTPHYVTEEVNRGNGIREDDKLRKKKSLRAASNTNDDPSYFRKNLDMKIDLKERDGDAQGYIRLRNERLDRMEQPLIASEHWRDVFSGDPALGKPSSTIAGPWQVSAFALLGVVVVLSAIFLHMVAENNSDSNGSPYNTYRRRQRHARRMYKTRKKKTDEWSDDEEDFILRTQAGLVPEHIAAHPPQGEDTQYYPYYLDQGVSAVAAAAAAPPGFAAQEHRQRRTSFKEPITPPSASASGGRGTYYMPANPTYKNPSASIHRRGISPGNSFSSNKSSSRSPGPALRATTAIGGGYSSSGSHAPSPSHSMHATAPLSGRLRVPSTPDGKDLFPSIIHSHSMQSSGSHGIMQPTLPTPPEESQLPAAEAQLYDNLVLPPTHGGTRRELGARPLNSSNFSSFASMDGSGDERGRNSSNRARGGSHDTPLSASLLVDERIHDAHQTPGIHSQNSRSLQLHESHHQSLLLSPGNYDAATPQIGNNRRKVFSPDQIDFAMPDMNSALMPPGGSPQHNMPFIPALNFSQHTSHDRSDSPPLHYAASRPPRSILLDELRIVQMETGNSTHWAVQEVSDSFEPSDSQASFEGDDEFLAELQGGAIAKFDDGSASEEGSDIPIPSGDPRGGIKHKRDDLTMDTNAYKSLQSNIEFEEITLEEVIGGGGFGQVWRATWFGTPVAVKVLTGSAQNQHIAKAILEEFKAEINLLKGMRHPNICLYMGACVRPPNRAIVTELAANGSVWDALRLPLSPPYVPADGTARGTWPLALYVPGEHGAPPSDVGAPRISAPIPPKGSWPWQLVKRVASGAARGMAYLHHGNPPVLHRDLKSANLLLDDSYTAKVCDFGLSRLKAGARSMTGNCGTVQWMAPEVLANTTYDEKADVFSYGIILWELLSRECPYEGMTAIQCALAVLNRDKRPEIPKWCPPSFHALIKSCVKKDPALRPSFSQVILALDAMEA